MVRLQKTQVVMKKQRSYGVISLKLFVVMRRKAKLFVRIADKQEICEWICLGKEHCVMIVMRITCKKFKQRNRGYYGLY